MQAKSIIAIHLRESIKTGGHKRYFELLKGLEKNGHKITLIKRRNLDVPLEKAVFLNIDGLEKKSILPFSFRYYLKIFRKIKGLKKLCTEADWVLVFGENNFLPAYLIKRIYNAKILCALRSNFVEAFDLTLKDNFRKKIKLVFQKRMEKQICRDSDVLVFQTEHDRQDIVERSGCDINKTYVIRNNITASWFLPEYKNKNKSKNLKNIIFIGSFGERKGLKYLLEAFRDLIAEGLDLFLTIVGYGNEERVKRFISDNNLQNKTKYIGKVDNPLKYLSEADILIVPSLYDSYPNIVLESFHTGTPVIGADTPGIRDIIADECYLFTKADSDDIKDFIKALYNDNSEYLRLKKFCRKRAEYFEFDWCREFEKVIGYDK